MADTPENIGEQIAKAVERHKRGEIIEGELDTQISNLRNSIRDFLDEAKDPDDRLLREKTFFLAIEKISKESNVLASNIAILLFLADKIDQMTFGTDPLFERAVLLYVAQRDCQFVLKNASSYKGQPYAAEIILTAAENRPWIALKYADLYKDQPYAAEIILTEAEKDPQAALKYADLYKDQPYAASVIEKAARTAAEKDPRTALKYADLYKDQPYAAEIILTEAEKDPQGALQYADLYKDQPYAASVIEKAARTAAEKDPWIALQYLDIYKDQPYAAEIIRTVAEKRPSIALQNALLYKDQPYAAEIIRTATEKDPWSFINNFAYFKSTLGKDADVLFAIQIKRIEISGKGVDLPPKIIQSSDFPLNRPDFELFLMGINHESVDRFELITVPIDRFHEVFFSKPYQDFLKSHTGKMTYMNAFSIAQAVCRLLFRDGARPQEENIRDAVRRIAEQRDRIRTRELFGPDTKLILFTHEEKQFSNEKILKKIYRRAGGKEENILMNAKGIEIKDGKNVIKEKVLDAIRNAKGATTVLFSGHGSQENWAFSRNQANDLDHSMQASPTSINYQELGDALIASGNIGHFNIIGSTCLAYDYLLNLFRYMESKGFAEKPYVSISAANKAKFGWGGGEIIDDIMLEAFHKVSRKGEPIRVEHFYRAEGNIWRHEDPALFIGTESIGSELPVAPVLPPANSPPPAKPFQGEANPIMPHSKNPTESQPAPENFMEISAKEEPEYFTRIV